MEELPEFITLLSQREEMYSFLGHLYKVEVDPPVLEYLRGVVFPSEGDSELIEGYRLMKEYVNQPGFDPLTDLAADYARIFLGAGITDIDQVAYPYESVYTNEKKLIMQEARDEMLATLRKNRLEVNNPYNEPEDHIFVHFEFMAFLCKKSREAIANDNFETYVDCLQQQKKFLEDHLLNWIPGFCSDVEKHAGTDFYRGIAKVTKRYIFVDLAMIEEMIPQYAA
jgi:anaerobic sulfite reductase subunit A